MMGEKVDYKHKVVFITGASSGIGEGLARAFAKEGAFLVLMARRTDRLEGLAKTLDPTGQQMLVCSGDVTKDQDVASAVAAAIARFKGIDLVIANAGFSVSGKFESLSIEDYRRQFETNVFGVLRTIKVCLPSIKSRQGQVALMGSVAGFVSQPFVSPYAMSKFALTALSESLYHELIGHGVGVSLIAPGFVQSEIQQIDKNGKFDPLQKRWIPDWITVSTESAVAEMLHGLKRRKPQIIVTNHGRILVFLNRFMPWILRGSVQWAAQKRLKGISTHRSESGSNQR